MYCAVSAWPVCRLCTAVESLDGAIRRRKLKQCFPATRLAVVGCFWEEPASMSVLGPSLCATELERCADSAWSVRLEM